MMRTLLSSLSAALPLTLSALCAGEPAAAKSLRIYWTDVEGGAATLIVTPAGESVLVDTGMDNDRDPPRIAKTAKEIAGLEQIDHLVVTHFDVDHHGGAAELNKRIPIRKVYDPGDEGSRPQATFDKYKAFRATVPYAVLKPGDAVKRPELERLFLARLTERNGPGPARGGTGSARLTGRMECNGRGGRR